MRPRQICTHVVRAGVVVVVIASFAVCGANADIFHLKSGGTVDGELLAQSDTVYTVQTALGKITLPIDSVARIEKGEPAFREYARRKDAAPQTAPAQFELAEWCGKNGMARERTKHLQAAIAIDPDFEPARKALGYVKVGELWVEGRSQAEEKKEERAREEKAKEPQSQPADDPEKVAAAMQNNWMKRIRAIKSSLLDSSVDRIRKRGEDEILDIKDPLAILPLAQVLGAGELNCRILLAKALMKFDEAEATMNIAALALVEPDPDFRADLMKLLVKRNDPRVVAQFRKALESNNDPLIRRAAYGLGELKSKEAVGELIAVLKARRVKAVEVRVDRYFNNMPDDFGSQSIAIGGASKINYKPVVGIPSGLISVQTEQRVMPVTVYRTEVLEALKKITGENFGFEEAEWTRWYQELKP